MFRRYGDIFRAILMVGLVFFSGLNASSFAQKSDAPRKGLLSPKRNFRLIGDDILGHRLQLVPTHGLDKRTELPLPNYHLQYYSLQPLSISPDEAFLLCDVKEAVGVNAVFLYKRVKGLQYKQVASNLNATSWPFYAKKTKMKIPFAFFEFVDWSRGSRYIRFNLVGDDKKTAAKGKFDTTRLTFQ